MPRESQLLVAIMYILVAVGVVMTYSASAVFADQLFKSPTYFLRRQLLYVIIGSFLFLVLASLDPEFLRRHSRLIMGVSLVMLITVFLPVIGHSAGGARRWIRLPLFTFQPVEFTKLAMCVYLADFLSRKKKPISEGGLSVFAAPTMVLLLTVGLVILQPDLGSCIFLFLLCGFLFFLSGIKFRYIAVAILLAGMLFAFLIIKAPYRLRRVTGYLDPWSDPQGSGFQIIQSFLAFGLGGIKGVGLGQGTQKLFYLPQSHTDFIFSIIGEEIGLVGGITLVALFLVFFLIGNRIANKCRNLFHRLLAHALILLVTLQALINFLVVLGLIPTKGLPLPFISYGGSALIFHMAAVGMLVAIDRSSSTGGYR